MKTATAMLAMLIATAAAQAGELRPGAHVRVPPGSIWFEDGAALQRWQAVRLAGDGAALASHQDRVLRAREAWQFDKPLDVKVITAGAATNAVEVALQTRGRLYGTRWLLDTDALAPSTSTPAP